MMNRRGISEIIATVLIVLIVVAAFVIVWQIVIPMVRDTGGPERDCLAAVQGITITQECLTSDNEISFRVNYGSKNVAVDKVVIIPYDSGGNSGIKQEVDISELNPNEEKTFTTGNVGAFTTRVAYALKVGGSECTDSTPKVLVGC